MFRAVNRIKTTQWLRLGEVLSCGHGTPHTITPSIQADNRKGRYLFQKEGDRHITSQQHPRGCSSLSVRGAGVTSIDSYIRLATALDVDTKTSMPVLCAQLSKTRKSGSSRQHHPFLSRVVTWMVAVEDILLPPFLPTTGLSAISSSKHQLIYPG